ncbi:hypothetical protein BpHYR1_025589 [Brachionus plicatilis]|uniref:Uncharacterized protein n=1 Tax=Brachionus plicatilis TaxID=10195 RepID=A0A3M7S4P3_BRAPC|nr:hypothetical protein BpHYR1_025589 [Brachionus plicatilis]
MLFITSCTMSTSFSLNVLAFIKLLLVSLWFWLDGLKLSKLEATSTPLKSIRLVSVVVFDLAVETRGRGARGGASGAVGAGQTGVVQGGELKDGMLILNAVVVVGLVGVYGRIGHAEAVAQVLGLYGAVGLVGYGGDRRVRRLLERAGERRVVGLVARILRAECGRGRVL